MLDALQESTNVGDGGEVQKCHGDGDDVYVNKGDGQSLFTSGNIDESNGILPCFDLPCDLTPGAGPAAAGVHAVIADCSLNAVSLAY